MMTIITTGTKAIDTRDGRTVTIGEKNSKCKTVIVFYDEPTEKETNGKSMSFSTVKKYFELQVLESDAETEKEETYDVVTDEVKETAAPETENTEKKARKPRKKKECNNDVQSLLSFIFTEWGKHGIIKTPAKETALFRPLCVESGRQVIKLMWTTKKISFFVRVESATVYAEKWQKINYAMPFQCMFFHDTEEVRQNMKALFQMVLENDSIRHKKAKQKGAE